MGLSLFEVKLYFIFSFLFLEKFIDEIADSYVVFFFYLFWDPNVHSRKFYM